MEMIPTLYVILLLLTIYIGTCSACLPVRVVGNGRSTPSRDVTPPTITCPSNIHKSADPIEESTAVTWDEDSVIVTDNSNDAPILTRTGWPPEHVFSKGVTTIYYHARDNSGNFASCSFNVTIEVIRCSTWDDVPDGWRVCNTGHDMRLGTVCEFGCSSGHVIEEGATRECQIPGQWDVATQPYCQKLKCPPLYPTPGQADLVSISCTNESYYRSKCTYTCAEGYGMLPGHNAVEICRDDGTWLGDTPVCFDTAPPVLGNCHTLVIGYAEPARTSGHVQWDNPTAIDNNGEPVPSIQILGPLSGSDLQVGQYDVGYQATDQMNNTGVCLFLVIVKQVTCPVLHSTQYTRIVCPEGRILGSRCDFYCDYGTQLNGEASVECIQSDATLPEGNWTFQGQPYCELTGSCPALTAPSNGALQCDTWEFGTFCQMLCDDGYVVMNDSSTDYDDVRFHETLLVCEEADGWTYNRDIPDCQEIDLSILAYLKIWMEYEYSGECSLIDSDPAIYTMLEQTMASALQIVCSPPICNITGIEMNCDNIVRRKRSAIVGFEISLDLPADMSSTDLAQLRSAIQVLTRSSEVYDDLSINLGGETSKPSNIDISLPLVLCDEGSAYNAKTLQCVKCNAGYYHNTGTDSCNPCPIGYFQDMPRQTDCIQCPAGTTTMIIAASLPTQCLGSCIAGFYSATGTPPCSACDLGWYSNTSSSTECHLCPGSQTTLTTGASSISQCQDFDVLYIPDTDGTNSFTAASVATELVNVTTFTISLWIQCTACEHILTLRGAQGDLVMSVGNENTLTLQLLSGYYDTGLDLSGTTTWMKLTILHMEEAVKIYINEEEVLQEPLDTSITENVANPFTLYIAGIEFHGVISQLHMWSYVQLPTSNESDTCFASVNGDLVQWRQFTEADGTYVVVHTNCDAVDDCASSPCEYNSTCTDTIDGFTCTCMSGYTGSTCDTAISYCDGHACDNNAVCIDAVDSYVCECTSDFTGEYCQLPVVDGGWTSWVITGACSVSCGSGVQQRSRVCEDPVASNGGTECQGDSDGPIECHTNTSCINECAEDPTTLDYGELNCNWTTNATQLCTPVCHDGYEFDNDIYVTTRPLQCGPDTGYTWNIRNGENPHALIPACTRKKIALKNIMLYSTLYPNLPSLDTALEIEIEHKFNGKLAQTGCLATERCTLVRTSVFVTPESTRRKRNVQPGVILTSELTCEPTSSMDDCYDLLVDVVGDMEQYVEQNEFTVRYNGVDYNIGVNSSSIDGTSDCSEGYVPVWQYCVPCGKGTCAVSNYCTLCELGYYQDETAQTSCKLCPTGLTTEGLMTRDRNFCNVPIATEDGRTDWQVITLASLAGVFCMMVITATVYIIWERNCKKPDDIIDTVSIDKPQTPPEFRFNMRNVWYRGKASRTDPIGSYDYDYPSLPNTSQDIVEDITYKDHDFSSMDLPETPVQYGAISPSFRFSSPISFKQHAWK